MALLPALGAVLACAFRTVPQVPAAKLSADAAGRPAAQSASGTAADAETGGTAQASTSAVPTLAAGLVPEARAQSLPPPADPDPVAMRIPAIGLVAPVIKTGLETDGSLHVPSSPDQTGWYDLGPKPGDVGPAVITGHLDSALGPGILFHLKSVKIGDEVDVVRNDGSTAVFVVNKLAAYPQDNFNTQAVYGSIATAELRIITCAGTYSKTAKHYSEDLVVFATLKQILKPAPYQPGQPPHG